MAKLITHIMAGTTAILIAAGPVQAEKAAPENNMQDQAETTLKEGVQKILKALETMFRAIPQYEMPEVLDNGDIIIRRKKPEPPETPDDTDQT